MSQPRETVILLPRLYAVLDAARFPSPMALFAVADELEAAGVTLMQYRNKSGNAGRMLYDARELRKRLGSSVCLIMNDRADLSLAADCEGVHVGQDDLSPAGVRRVIGPNRILGVSTHSPDQLREADATSADYIAIGPVFWTKSKENPDPVVGLDGVRRARALTKKPLVGIGGITRENARSVIEAGADSVAVISDLSPDPGKSAEEFFRILG